MDSRKDKANLVNPIIGAHSLTEECNIMTTEEIGIYIGAICSRTLASLLTREYIGVLVCIVLKVLILKSSYDVSRMNSPNAQAYNHTNAIIIGI
jgi:hypothetical protein